MTLGSHSTKFEPNQLVYSKKHGPCVYVRTSHSSIAELYDMGGKPSINAAATYNAATVSGDELKGFHASPIRVAYKEDSVGRGPIQSNELNLNDRAGNVASMFSTKDGKGIGMVRVGNPKHHATIYGAKLDLAGNAVNISTFDRTIVEQINEDTAPQARATAGNQQRFQPATLRR